MKRTYPLFLRKAQNASFLAMSVPIDHSSVVTSIIVVVVSGMLIVFCESIKSRVSPTPSIIIAVTATTAIEQIITFFLMCLMCNLLIVCKYQRFVVSVFYGWACLYITIKMGNNDGMLGH